jgi:prepilin-type N-terminal cleavage/methylation domain-containing protein
MQARASLRGFSLVELAIVMAIVAFLLAGLMFTLSAQTEQRNIEETRRRLELARELVMGFAVVNGRLPCPARSTSAGAEARDVATGQCTSGGVEDYYGGTLSGGATGGLLPAQTIGFQLTDSSGFAVDAWQNRIRYAVAKSITSGTCAGTFTNPHFVNAANMKANGIACQPGDLIVCKSSSGITSSACGGGNNQVVTSGLVVAIFLSMGKNGASGSAGADEAANLNGAGNADPVFVYHTPSSSSATGGEFDDQMLWITVGELYGKLIAAGQLP